MTDTIASTNFNWRKLGWSLALVAFAIPFLASLLTSEVKWSLLDYAVWALLLTGLGVGLEFAAKLMRSTTGRTIAMIAVGAFFFLLWAELATGGISRRLLG